MRRAELIKLTEKAVRALERAVEAGLKGHQALLEWMAPSTAEALVRLVYVASVLPEGKGEGERWCACSRHACLLPLRPPVTLPQLSAPPQKDASAGQKDSSP